MAKKYTHTEAFAFYGTKPKNVFWSWSAVSEDGKTVAVTLWKDKFEGGGKTYRSSSHSGDPKWKKSPGHPELLRNLRWALDNCDGLVRVIVADSTDMDASPRSIAFCYPQRNLVMRIAHLDDATGEFELQRVE